MDSDVTEITERLFPPAPPESPDPGPPIPLQRSIREEFVIHRRFVERELVLLRETFQAALQQTPELSPVSAARRVASGAALAGKGTAVVVAVLGALEVLLPLIKPEWAGPLGQLRKAFGG